MQFIGKLLMGALLLILFIAALIYGSDNSTPVPLAFLGWETGAWPVAWWVICAFLLGGLGGVLLGSALNVSLRMRLRKTRKELDDSRGELDRLRTLNLK